MHCRFCNEGSQPAGKKVLSNQYSLTEYYSPVQKGEVQLPAIYFLYDLSPIMVSVKDARASLAHLLVRLCAVIGGVFAITGGLAAAPGRVCGLVCMQQLLSCRATVCWCCLAHALSASCQARYFDTLVRPCQHMYMAFLLVASRTLSQA